MKLLEAWSAETNSHHGPKPLLPDTTVLGIQYQPDWLDVLGLVLIFAPVVLLTLLLAVR